MSHLTLCSPFKKLISPNLRTQLSETFITLSPEELTPLDSIVGETRLTGKNLAVFGVISKDSEVNR